MSLATLLALICGAPLLDGHRAIAADARDGEQPSIPASPDKAILSPHGGRLSVSQELATHVVDGRSVFSIVLPAYAANPQITARGHGIVRWITEPVILGASGRHSTYRAGIENRRRQMQARLDTVTAMLDVLQAQTGQAGAHDLAQRQSLMDEDMPKLALEREKLRERLAQVKQELADLPATSGVGTKITVTLANNLGKDQKVTADYSYDLQSCGWSAAYDFDALPDDQGGDKLSVRLLADVWQFTGMDWTGTEITLATLGNGPREPQPLPAWIIGSVPAPQPKAATLSAKAARSKDHAAEASNLAVTSADAVPPPPSLPVMSDTTAIYATWTLAARGLPEGRSRIQISSDTWQAPLQWLARPNRGDNRVWLYAKYALPANQAWPAGSAQFSMDGQSVGEGQFQPKGSEVTLYFGADPRVNIRTTIDSSKEGQTGFINTSKTWTWAWTYTLNNEHVRAIKVRVERPEPQTTNTSYTITYKDNPPAKKDEKEHMLYWEVEVPAHGKTSIEHGVTVSSPEKLPLLPDVP